MFIRESTHTDNRSGRKYRTYKLVESVRTERGPRQRTLLNIGAGFSLPQEQWKELANRIEAIISGQISLFPVPEEIERFAQMYARKIIRRHGQKEPVPAEENGKPDFQTVDINSLDHEQIRSVGGESVILAAIKELELDRTLEALGFNKPNVDAAIGVIAARLLAPASERATHLWLQSHTALDDLLETRFESLSQDRVYKVSDMLLRNKAEIETHLQNRERNLFNLDEKILLYDLTNTFFEGSGKYNPKAHFGISKENRSDCPLLTLALLFEAGLTDVQKALSRKGGTKKYEKVLGKIGRLKERYRRVSRRYKIEVEKDETSGKASGIHWRMKPMDDTSGYYMFRCSRTDYTEKEVFDIFTMLLDLEDAFRSMKSEQGLRPVHHQYDALGLPHRPGKISKTIL